MSAGNYLNYPIINLNSSKLPVTPPSSVYGATMNVTHVNFLTTASQTVISSQEFLPSSIQNPRIKNCADHFSKRYATIPKDPYHVDSGVSPANRLFESDSTFLNEPNGGWFSLNALGDLTVPFYSNQKNEYFLVAIDPNVDPDLVGSRSYNVVAINAPGLPLTSADIPYYGYTTGVNASGFLNTMEMRILLNFDLLKAELTNYRIVPTFDRVRHKYI